MTVISDTFKEIILSLKSKLKFYNITSELQETVLHTDIIMYDDTATIKALFRVTNQFSVM